MIYNIIMRKINKIELVNILKNKNNKTYKDLAIETGYHEKSLIRINAMLKKNEYTLVNKKRIPSRHIDNIIRDRIVNDYKSNNYKNYKNIYIKYKDNVSYSYVCKLLNNIRLDDEILVIAKIKDYYIAIDYNKLVVLYKTPIINSSINNVLLYIIKNYGIPKNVYFYNIRHNRNYLLDKYNINVLTNLKIVNKSIYYFLNKNINIDKNNVKYNKYIYSRDDFYNHIKRKVLRNNLVQFNNIRYRIISSKLIDCYEKVDVYYNSDMSDIYIKYKNKTFNLRKEKIVNSIKGLTKYK